MPAHEQNGSFYVHQYEEIRDSELSIVKRTGTTFSIEWLGLCDIHWDERYNVNVPFSVRANVPFKGVLVRGNDADSPDTMRQRLGSTLNPDDFEQTAIQHTGFKDESGRVATKCIFIPRA